MCTSLLQASRYSTPSHLQASHMICSNRNGLSKPLQASYKLCGTQTRVSKPLQASYTLWVFLPIGRTPGFLSRAMSLHAMRDETLDGSTRHVQRRLAVAAKEWQSSSEVDLKEVHNLFHPMASKPDGPALPSARRVASLMQWASRESKITGWID